jgi:ATP-dependent exoDNAse (exonuclease V) alpha subunit
LLSPIIRLATAIRTDTIKAGVTSVFPELANGLRPGQPVAINSGEHGKVTLHCWKVRKKDDASTKMKAMAAFLPQQIINGHYRPDEDMILCPFNVSFGTVELNKHVAEHQATSRNAIVHEVIARYIKSYWAVGDKVMVDRHEAIITDISPTPGYVGKIPQHASVDLNRWGTNRVTGEAAVVLTADDILNQLDALGADEEENSKNLASHTIKVHIPDLDETKTLNTSGDINSMTFGYAITVHKSQGSEWRRVFILLHGSHATMLSRELLYTAVTRAKEELYIICEGDIAPYKNQILTASSRGVIPGTLLSEKIEYFKGKKQAMGSNT